MAILLKRNAKVFISLVDSGWTVDDTIRLNTLDSLSLSHSELVSGTSRNTLGPSGDRAVHAFSEGLSSVQFTLTTYLANYAGILSSNLLWKALTNKTDSTGTIDFIESNSGVLPELFIYIVLSDTVTYKISSAIVTNAKIDMALGVIPTVTWECTGKQIESTIGQPGTFLDEFAAIPETIGKLTTADLTRNGLSYSIGMTAFTLNIDNGASWISRARLGVKVAPEAYVVGDRELSGSMKVYMKTGNTQELHDDMLSEANTADEDLYSHLTVRLGGNIVLEMPKILLSLQNIDLEDAIMTSFPFTVLQSAAMAADELLLSTSERYAIDNPTWVSLSFADPTTNTTSDAKPNVGYGYMLDSGAVAPGTQDFRLDTGTLVDLSIWQEISSTYTRTNLLRNLSATSISGFTIDAAATNVVAVLTNKVGTTQDIAGRFI